MLSRNIPAHLEVVGVHFDKVHEEVELGGSRLGGVDTVGLLHGHYQRGGHQSVAQHDSPLAASTSVSTLLTTHIASTALKFIILPRNTCPLHRNNGILELEFPHLKFDVFS